MFCIASLCFAYPFVSRNDVQLVKFYFHETQKKLVKQLLYCFVLQFWEKKGIHFLGHSACDGLGHNNKIKDNNEGLLTIICYAYLQYKLNIVQVTTVPKQSGIKKGLR